MAEEREPAAPEDLFRNQALHRLSSPEQLDQQMRVAGPMGWAVVGTIAFLLVVAMVWGLVGSIPSHVSGVGILRFRGGGVRQVVARGNAQLVEVTVAVGQPVAAGDVIARLSNLELRQKVADAQRTLETLRTDRDHTVEYFDGLLQQESQYFAEIRENTLALIKGGDEQIQANRRIVLALEDLLRQHYTTSIQVEQARERLFEIRAMRDQNREKLIQTAIDQLELIRTRTAQIESYDLKIVEAEGTLREAAVELELSEKLTSPLDGRVVQVLAEEDAMLSDATPVALIEYGAPVLEALLYVPAGRGKEVELGMRANIAPQTVKKVEYGTLIGVIRRVGLYPSTRADMLRALNDENLVDSFLTKGPPLALVTALEPDPDTTSGYRWSSGEGPPVTLSPGTLTTVTVTVRDDPPISLVIPGIRRFLGIYP